jgi:hypothetical protein
MPWWAIIYLVVFVAFSIFADMLAKSDGTSRLRWLADLLAGAVFAVLFAGFWLTSIYRALGFVAPALFVAAVGWELYSSPANLREIWRDRELSRAERVGLILLPPLLAWPLYVVAGVGVFSFHDRA